MQNSINHIIGHRNRIKKKFLEHKESLFDYELLELLLFYALPRKDVKPLSKSLIKEFGNLKNVLKSPTEKLSQIKGLSSHSIVLLQLIFTLTQKILEYDLKEQSIVKNWQQLLDYCFLKLSNTTHEQIFIIYLNSKNFIIKDEIIAEGSLNSALINCRLLMQKCLNIGAASIIIAHNHPSGNLKPSKEDIKFTKELSKITKSLNIFLYDHLIVSTSGVYSFRGNNLINE